MPIIKSAAKRVRQAEKRQTRNAQTKRTLRESTKALEAAVISKDTKKLPKLLADVYGAYDTAVKKNLIHKNKAARKKSHYSDLVKNASPAETKKAPAKKPAAKATTKKPATKK